MVLLKTVNLFVFYGISFALPLYRYVCTRIYANTLCLDFSDFQYHYTLPTLLISVDSSYILLTLPICYLFQSKQKHPYRSLPMQLTSDTSQQDLLIGIDL